MSGADRQRTRWFLRSILPHEPALRGWLSRSTPPGVDPTTSSRRPIRSWPSWSRGRAIRHPRAYLFQVARSVIMRHVRRARIVPIHTCRRSGAARASRRRAASPEQYAIDRDELRQLARAIAAMPLKTREAFVLRRVTDMPQREIAARMRISENTVETHISRGILFLIDWFGRSGNKRSQTSRNMEAEIASIDGRARHQSRH
jgi:RNA polymerase sigma factor (sigma-70 family)